jgi:hypothetical protein
LSIEFRQHIKSIAIEIKEVLVKAHNSVGKVERYYAPLRRAYKIIYSELVDEQINKEVILQMVVKAINDLARPDRIILTLLVFGVYPRMTNNNTLLLLVIKRAIATRAATKEVRRL